MSCSPIIVIGSPFDDSPRRARAHVNNLINRKEAGRAMDTITIPRTKLLAQLRTNRDEHQARFAEAHKAFRKKAAAKLRGLLDAIESDQKVKLHVDIVEPRDHTADYDRVVAMMEWETEEEIKLSSRQFAQYVQDNWQWSEEFKVSYSSNTGKAY